jgi:hypothetical protein
MKNDERNIIKINVENNSKKMLKKKFILNKF